MKTHKRLLRVTFRANRSAGNAASRPSGRTVGRMAAGGVLALAVAVTGLGAARSAWPAQGGASHVQQQAHRPANNAVFSAQISSTTTVATNRLPWMY